MDNLQEIIKKVKEIWDNLDLIDLSQDIIDGNNLVIRKLQIPSYIIMPNGNYEWNVEYQINEKNIMEYINKIIAKYQIFINLYNFVSQSKSNVVYNNTTVSYAIENYIGLLLTLLQAKLNGKIVEEIFKKEN